MKIDRVNGYEIAYTVTDQDGKKVIETTDRRKAVAALADDPARSLDTRALGGR